MILTDRINTLTIPESDDSAVPIQNSSLITTIGGRRKSQADSKRLKITSRMRIPQDDAGNEDIVKLSAIISNFSASLYFTPQRVLWDKVVNEEIEVVLSGDPVIEERLWDCGLIYWVVLEFEEVI